jgi:hypothetical protein
MSIKLLEAFLETIFDSSVSALHITFASDFVNHCPFRTLLVLEREKFRQ